MMSLPVAPDTNVLGRLLGNDDPAQAEQAAALIDASAACFVLITVAPAGYGLCRCAPLRSQRGLRSADQS